MNAIMNLPDTTACAASQSAGHTGVNPRQNTDGCSLNTGFTLIELVITLLIIVLLAKIAYPAYTSTLQKSRRSDAKAGLLDLASREEKYYSMHNQYTANATLLYSASSAFPLAIQSSSTSYYQLNVTVTAASSTAVATYTGTATPTGVQANDLCGTYSITNQGLTSVSTTAAGCW